MKKIFFVIVVLLIIAAFVVILRNDSTPKFDNDLKGKEVSISYYELNVREQPNTDSEIIGTLHMGDKVSLSGYYVSGTGSSTLPEDFGWVELSDGGWIIRKAVDFH